jgi:hypothetical protein
VDQSERLQPGSTSSTMRRSSHVRTLRCVASRVTPVRVRRLWHAGCDRRTVPIAASTSGQLLLLSERRLNDRFEMTPNYAMQRSALVVTPLAGIASGVQIVPLASGAPTARRR